MILEGGRGGGGGGGGVAFCFAFSVVSFQITLTFIQGHCS